MYRTFSKGNMVLVDIEGPLNSFHDWNTCWSVYAHSRLRHLLTHAVRFSGQITKGDIFPFPSIGEVFEFRIICVEDESEAEVTVRSVRPHVDPSPLDDSLRDLPKTPVCLVHGVSFQWVPKGVAAWHALDIFANACTDDCLLDIFHNLKKSNVESFIVWGIDCMQSNAIQRIIQAASGLVRIVLVASQLHLIEPKLLELIKPDHIVSRRTETAEKQNEKAQQYPIPDISGIPESAIELADTYFVTPIAYPKLVASFASAIPTLASPKILICGPPRSGKTTLANWIIAKSVSGNAAITVFQTRSSSLFSKYLGSSEKRVMKLFKRAEAAAPSILLIEGIHTLCPSRMRDNDNDGETGVEDTYNRMVATFLTCLDGLDTRDRKIAVIGTSLLEPEKLDPAAIRPGRLELHITLPPILESFLMDTSIIRLPSVVKQTRFSPNQGSVLAIVTADPIFRQYSHSGELVSEINTGGDVFDFDYYPGYKDEDDMTKAVLIASRNRPVNLFSSSGTVLSAYTALSFTDEIIHPISVRFSPQCSLICGSFEKATLRLWDVQRPGCPVSVLTYSTRRNRDMTTPCQRGLLSAVEWDGTDNGVFVGSYSSTIWFHDVRGQYDSMQIGSLALFNGVVQLKYLSNNGCPIVLSGHRMDEHVHAWDLRKSDLPLLSYSRITKPTYQRFEFDVSQDQQLLYCGDSQGRITVSRISDGEDITNSISISPAVMKGSSSLVSVSVNGKILACGFGSRSYQSVGGDSSDSEGDTDQVMAGSSIVSIHSLPS